jgi:cysteine desulfurase
MFSKLMKAVPKNLASKVSSGANSYRFATLSQTITPNNKSDETCSISKMSNWVPQKKAKAIYLDMQATTPLDFRVLDAMLPYMTNLFGNPHSKTHEYGWEADEAVEAARKKIATLIGAEAKEIIFTSGATESNNMTLKGLAKFYKSKKHVITTQIEHKCILDSCRHLEEEGYEVTYLPVQPNGLLDLNLLKDSIRSDTLCVSTIFVHNEIGVIQDVKAIGKMCRERKVLFHTDAAQAVGKIPIDVKDMNIDLLSISGHKIYGPKGVGALYRRAPQVKLVPLINGGGQEKGLRSGTLAPHLIVGLGEACEIARKEMKSDDKHLSKLFNKLLSSLQDKVPYIKINGCLEKRFHGNLNISFAYVEGESLMMALKSVALSSGSACTSSSLEPSYVLRALGVEDELAHTSIRFGLGRFTTEEEVDYVIDRIITSVEKLREISPLWEMVKEGVDLKSIEWSQPH